MINPSAVHTHLPTGTSQTYASISSCAAPASPLARPSRTRRPTWTLPRPFLRWPGWMIYRGCRYVRACMRVRVRACMCICVYALCMDVHVRVFIVRIVCVCVFVNPYPILPEAYFNKYDNITADLSFTGCRSMAETSSHCYNRGRGGGKVKGGRRRCQGGWSGD